MKEHSTANAPNVDHNQLLTVLGGSVCPTADQLKDLILHLDSHRVLAKVFLLEGTPYVFATSPMKYVIFREQVADRFNVGSQDVCIIGSAKLGYSPSPYKFGVPFESTSDVDVVIISEPLFYEGSNRLFAALKDHRPHTREVKKFLYNQTGVRPVVDLQDWLDIKDSLRNFVYENFNPGLLPEQDQLRRDIFDKITSTAGLFLALEPKVFVARLRARIFKSWKAAEDYYSNSLREAKLYFEQKPRTEVCQEDDQKTSEPIDANRVVAITPVNSFADQPLSPTPKIVSPSDQRASTLKLEKLVATEHEHKGIVRLTVTRSVKMLTKWVFLYPPMLHAPTVSISIQESAHAGLSAKSGATRVDRFAIHLSMNGAPVPVGEYTINYDANSPNSGSSVTSSNPGPDS